ncbi:MAG: sigma-54 dependent transcriptional regulator [Gammaproteobacteria bacterium]|nr:sigma-54 dependent transcriptional regulator [Gammaproteobacteria bacterium]MDH3429815.1 sigma-54 dependent transcriptional regulator [Gammaproteobacteria bacterium]MDH3433175.1 sigma-54 dependent transcriptional regulator [Gammaproteobacteria bacterium]
MASQGKVLILDSDAARASDLCSRLRFLNYEPVIPPADVSSDALARERGIAVVIGDMQSDDSLGRTLNELKAQQPSLPCLCLPFRGERRGQPDGGTNWTLDLPLKKSQLTRLLRRAARYQGSERRHRLTGNSTSIRRVRELIEQVADFDTNVLVTGQSGTGKELVARTIHDLSDRSGQPFVPINCGAIPADLLESELFGHTRGAFTGAISDRTGRFELAEGGTLFLDEIGDMSLDMQVKLLRVLQERSFERIGSNKTQQCDVRIIAATHRDLPAAVAAGEFREDLYYRLNVFPIEMPPLYKRVSDLPQLLQELLIQHVGDNAGSLRVSPQALRILANYSWPGNIRELSNLVERLAIIKPQGIIEVDDLPAKYCDASIADPGETNQVSEAMQLSHANLKDHLAALEQDLIRQAFEAADGVVAQAAKLLNMRRTTLVEKIRKYHIH